MLKTALVAMTIVGCDCDARLCEFVSETPVQWTSVAECEAAVKTEALRAPGQDYPLVTGICREVSDPKDENRPAPPTKLASLRDADGRSLYEVVLDGGGLVLDKTARSYALMKAGVHWTADHLAPTTLTAWIPAAAD